MTLSDLEWQFHTLCTMSAVAELFVLLSGEDRHGVTDAEEGRVKNVAVCD